MAHKIGVIGNIQNPVALWRGKSCSLNQDIAWPCIDLL